MRLNSVTVRNLYASLYCTYPFTKWKLPLPEEIDFQIIDDKDVLGTYQLDHGGEFEHTICISSARCAFFSTLVATLCHEVIHMSFYRQKGDKWLQHGKPFRTRCALVGREIGLDPLEL